MGISGKAIVLEDGVQAFVPNGQAATEYVAYLAFSVIDEQDRSGWYICSRAPGPEHPIGPYPTIEEATRQLVLR